LDFLLLFEASLATQVTGGKKEFGTGVGTGARRSSFVSNQDIS